MRSAGSLTSSSCSASAAATPDAGSLAPPLGSVSAVSAAAVSASSSATVGSSWMSPIAAPVEPAARSAARIAMRPSATAIQPSGPGAAPPSIRRSRAARRRQRSAPSVPRRGASVDAVISSVTASLVGRLDEHDLRRALDEQPADQAAAAGGLEAVADREDTPRSRWRSRAAEVDSSDAPTPSAACSISDDDPLRAHPDRLDPGLVPARAQVVVQPGGGAALGVRCRRRARGRPSGRRWSSRRSITGGRDDGR